MATLLFRGSVQAHTKAVTSIKSFPSNPLAFISSARDNKAVVWELDINSDDIALPIREFGKHNNAISDVAVFPDGQYVLTCSWDATARLHRVSDGESIAHLIGHKKDIFCGAFGVGGRCIMTAGRDRSICVWNVNGDLTYHLDGVHNDWINAIAYKPSQETQGGMFVTGSSDCTCSVWKLEPGEDGDLSFNQIASLVGHTGPITCVGFSADGTIIATGARDKKVYLWNSDSLEIVSSIPVEEDVLDLKFSAMNNLLAVCTPTSVKIWNLLEFQLVDTINADEEHGKFTCVEWNTDSTALLVGCTDGSIRGYQNE
ncbi:hypothetical protein PCE1_004022 [Barthelona sp. PCE]